MFFPLSFNKDQTLVSFPVSSDGKESACNVGDLGLILGWEDLLEKGKATHSNILAWENSMDCIAHGVAKSWTQLSDFHFHTQEWDCCIIW